MAPMNKDDFIPSGLYNQIVELLPIASAEALIVISNKLLFLKRKNEPAKGQWWFPGGRIRKGESIEEALKREVREETGLEISIVRLIDVYSRIFPERHDITIAYLCKCEEGNVVLNEEHSEYALFDTMPGDLHPFVLQTLRDSRWKEAAEK
jgi:colanic acid biosynthesis protein WcaH